MCVFTVTTADAITSRENNEVALLLVCVCKCVDVHIPSFSCH